MEKSLLKKIIPPFFILNILLTFFYYSNKHGVLATGSFLLFPFVKNFIATIIFSVGYVVILLLKKNYSLFFADLSWCVKRRERVGLIFLTGICGYAVLFLADSYALQYISSTASALLFSTTPLFILIFQRYSPKKITIFLVALMLALSCFWYASLSLSAYAAEFFAVISGAAACVFKYYLFRGVTANARLTIVLLAFSNLIAGICCGVFFVIQHGCSCFASPLLKGHPLSLILYAGGSLLSGTILFDYCYTYFSASISPALLSLLCSFAPLLVYLTTLLIPS